nr:MAG TPA: hypothetical protein [Caudoviricetes sp.]
MNRHFTIFTKIFIRLVILARPLVTASLRKTQLVFASHSS